MHCAHRCRLRCSDSADAGGWPLGEAPPEWRISTGPERGEAPRRPIHETNIMSDSTGLPSSRHRQPRLTHEAFERFRRQARGLLAAGTPPEAADGLWLGSSTLDDRQADLFATASTPAELSSPSASPLHTGRRFQVPRRFIQLARLYVLHRDADRFARLYRLLWRLVHEPDLRQDFLDPDWQHLRQMARAVQRDAYKMRAFVRFRPVHEGMASKEAAGVDVDVDVDVDTHGDAGRPARARQDMNAVHTAEPLHVAWFEPEHDVLTLVAPWFARRFAGIRWAILTPRGSLRWDPQTEVLQHGPAARREDAPAADAGEALWLTYYRHTFNPARLNLSLMQRHMPGRYWANLPEAAEIQRLAAEAPERLLRMTSAPALKPPESSTKPVRTKNT